MANAVPLAPTLVAPDNNGYVVVFDLPVVFAWTFNDPGDIQASASLRYKEPAGAWVTLTDVVGMPTTYTLPAQTLTTGILIEWQVQTKDTAGQWSPWSASRFFNSVTSLPAPTIITPANGATILVTPLLVSWDLPDGYTQDAYQVLLRRNEDPWSVYVDAGAESAVQSVMLDIPPVAATPGPLNLSVYYTYHGYQAVRTIAVTNTILAPEVPLVVLAQVPDLAHPPLLRPEVTVSVTCPPASDAEHLDTASVDILRDGVRIKTGLAPNTVYTDRLPGAGERDYVAVAKTTFGGTAESF